MLEHVAYVAVYVTDQDRALDFYTNVLGFERRLDNPTPDGPRFLTVGIPGQAMDLVLWPGTPGRGEPALGAIPAQYTVEVADCRSTFEVLRARGVTFTTPTVIERRWGLVATLQDLDGNLLQLREGRR